MIRLLSVIALTLLTPALVLPDIIYLKTGYIIVNADVLEMNEDYVLIKTERARNIPVENISKILFRQLVHSIPSSIIAVDDTLALSHYFSSVDQQIANNTDNKDSVVTVFLRNDSTLQGTISISNNVLSVTQGGPIISDFDADEIRRVTDSRGNAIIFGSDENRFFTISDGTFSFMDNDSLDRSFPFKNSFSLGIGVGNTFGSSHYTLSRYAVPEMIDNFTTRYSGSISYEHRAFQRIYFTLCGEYSRTRFETSEAVLFLEIMGFRGGVTWYLPGTDAIMPFVLIQYGYAFAFLPIYSSRHISERSEGGTLSAGFGFLLSQRFSLAATYMSYQLTSPPTNREANSLRTLMFTLHFHVNQGYAHE